MSAGGSTAQAATGNQDIDGLLSGTKWAGMNIDFNFPTSAAYYPVDYGSLNDEPAGFVAVPADIQDLFRAALDSYAAVANVTFTEVGAGSTSDISTAFTDSNLAGNPGFAYSPGAAGSAQLGGDVWFTSAAVLPVGSVIGHGAWELALHEIGHAMGLKHSFEAGGPADTMSTSAHDFNDYTVMSDRRYEGGPLEVGDTDSGEEFGYPQTLMMLDIAALQVMYGANFSTNSGDTTYAWNPATGEMSINGVGQGAPGANRIYSTIWDGNGTDTYDLSGYTTDVSIDLSPGGKSIFSDTQLALVDTATSRKATGNVFNALQYNGDARSLIENAVGGSGDDQITGNDVANVLIGGAGGDALDGGDGSDTASYASSPMQTWGAPFDLSLNGVLVDLLTNANSYGDATGDHFTSIENLIGSDFNDILLGGSDANTLMGGAGDDFIFGRFGADVIHGGDGNDTLFGDDASGFPDGTPGIAFGADQIFGDAGNDNLFGEGGADYLDGGDGTDLANYSTSPFGVTVDLVNGQGYGPVGSYAAGDTYANIENVRGSNFDDILIGTPGNNTLEGMGGNDLLIGSVGADILSGGPGTDTFAISSVAEGGDIIADFDPNGEVIDLSTLFAAHGLSTADPIGDGILQIEDLFGDGQHTVINLDLDGSAGPADPFTLFTLVNVNPLDVTYGLDIIV